MPSFPTIRRRRVLGAAAAMSLSPALHAQRPHEIDALPDGPFRFVLGTTAGGSMDSLGRLLARHMNTVIGKTFLVENRPGANGVLAAEWVSTAQNSGVNLFMGLSSQLLLNQLLYKRMPIDLRTDLSRLYMLSMGALYLSVNPQKTPGIQSLPELMALVRKRPRELAYASTGPGSYAHLMGERLNQLMGGQMVHVPCKGETQMTQALIAGEVDLAWPSAQQFLQFPDQLRALAGSGDTRMAGGLPEVPTFAEAGLPDEAFSLQAWGGVVVSSRTSPEVKNALGAAIAYTLQRSPLAAQSAAIRIPLITDSSPQQFEAFYDSEYPKWERLVRSLEITLD